MTDAAGNPDSNSPSSREERLDALRNEASRAGVAAGQVRAPNADLQRSNARAGYYGRPMVKPPVWTWEVPTYFFIGGLSGCAAVIAFAALVTQSTPALVRSAMWLAAVGATISPILLTMDLGRPTRFLNMMRVFKWRSPMSVGAWTLAVFGGASVTAAALVEWTTRNDSTAVWLGMSVFTSVGMACLSGVVIATYTGVLLGATSIPVWSQHRRLLPVHFGVAGMGSAAAALELLGHHQPALFTIGLAAAGVETVLGATIEIFRQPSVDRPLREGRSGLQLRAAGILAGPASLLLRLLGFTSAAGVSFLAGAFVSRFGWLAAGRASARDPEATIAQQLCD